MTSEQPALSRGRSNAEYASVGADPSDPAGERRSPSSAVLGGRRVEAPGHRLTAAWNETSDRPQGDPLPGWSASAAGCGHRGPPTAILTGVAGDVDVRDLYDEALAWVAGLMRTVPASLLSRSTPCPEFSVRALMGHLVGTAERGLATAQHRSTTSIPHVVTDPDEAFATR